MYYFRVKETIGNKTFNLYSTSEIPLLEIPENVEVITQAEYKIGIQEMIDQREARLQAEEDAEREAAANET